ncbi:response regulator [Cohnella sp. REN36]|uniref:response regulator n=2 Tax=Cohnella sp. REN36 TaxID=2887347 RepID=UPI0035656ECA
MFRVFIVDDEPIIRSGLTHFIDWKQCGCEIAGQAGDGLAAKDQIDVLLPDIVITDIKMSGMDGLELSKFLYERYPHMKIIMLTGYADFEYAQKAIRYGVVDFLLKPTTNEQIIQAIHKAIGMLDKENRTRSQFALVREKFFQDTVYGILSDPTTILDKSVEYGIDVQSFSLGLFDIHSLRSQSDQSQLKSVGNLIYTAFQSFYSYSFALGSDKIGVLIQADELRIAFVCQDLIQSANTLFGLRISAGISGNHQGITEIHTAYQEALAAISLGFEAENDVVFFRSDMRARAESYQQMADAFCERIFGLVQDNRLDSALEEIRVGFEVKKIFQHAVEKYKLAAIQLCLLLWKRSHESASGIHDRFLSCDTIADVAQALMEEVKNSSRFRNASESNAIVAESLAFIHKNYHQEMQLQTIADAVYVNSSYLSRLFHKETGETVTEAITKIRMEKARELLAKSEIKTQEIATMVGFDNPSYFSATFKKRFGLTPKAYRFSQR